MIDWYKNNTGPSSIWYCNYYGVPIFLCASDVNNDTGELSLYELKTVKYVYEQKKGVALSFNEKDRCFRPKERYKCYINNRLKPNCYSKANIKATPHFNSNHEIVINIKIEYNSSLYKDMLKLGQYSSWKIPNLTLEFRCIGDRKKYSDIINTYWKITKGVTEEDDSFDA